MSETNPYDVTEEQQGPPFPPDNSAAAESPERIGRYRIEKVLGRGGFGLVYLAHDERLDRPMAVKVPHAKLITRPEDAAEYLAEARTVANLDHPGIVPVHDVGSTPDCPCYIVSKYIEGTDLSTKLKQQRLRYLEAVELVAPVAEASVTTTNDDDSLLAASVWHRPRVPFAANDALGKEQAEAAVALLKMNEGERVWPLLEHAPEPGRRSHLMRLLSARGVHPRTLIERLEIEKEDSIRRALILALGEFSDQQLPSAARELLAAQLLEVFSTDSDAGIHAASEWVLRRWAKLEELKQRTIELATDQPVGEMQWFINRQGQALTVIAGPSEFLMGSPVEAVGREGGPGGKMEMQHHERINRTYAIMSHEVTVDQYLKFRPDFDYSKQYAREGDAPITRISWYAAAEYCNWLSQQESIPEDQWCYSPNDDGEYGVGMKPAPDYLERRGYRLPTEAEWEFACAAGAQTSYCCGDREDLLVDYAWFKKNSGDRWMLPVGSLKPNDLGLFDMQGNAWEWCHEVSRFVSISMTGEANDDLPDISEAHNNQRRALRGGSFLSQPDDVRSARRFRYQPSFHNYSVGMRVARTLDTLRGGSSKGATPSSESP